MIIRKSKIITKSNGVKKILWVSLALIFLPALAHAEIDHLVISQIQTTGGTGHTTNDFIEIYNPTSADIDLKGYRLVKRTKTGATDTSLKSWTNPTIIRAHGFYLWANSAFTDIGTTADTTTTGSIADDNGVAIRNGANDTGTIVDSVAWGAAANVFVEGTVFTTNPTANQSLERLPGSDAGNGTDTNNNATDFFLQTAAHPRNSLTAATPTLPPATPSPSPSPTPSPAPIPPPTSEPEVPQPPIYSSDIKISEILPNPDGKDDGEEWIEFFNNSSQDVDLSGWTVDDEGQAGVIGTDAYVFPDQTLIKAKSYFALNLPAEAFALNNTGGDTVRLFWPNNTMITQVIYADTAREDLSLALRPDGGYDWTALVTKGAPNEFEQVSLETGIISSAEIKIKINEIFPNPKGPDSGAEWVEIVNSGIEPVYLHNWVLDDGQADSPIGSSSYKIQSPTIAPGGLAVLVIPAGKFSLNNTSDTVRLFNENKVLIDSVSYQEAVEDLSYAQTDGRWVWGQPTPNAQNVQSDLITEGETSLVVISELFPEPSAKNQQEEFIELYNPGSTDADVTGFTLADMATDYKLSGVIPALSYLVVSKSESHISLNNSGKETISLIDPKGVTVAAVEYEDAPPNQSYNLTADGTFAWSTKLTPGQANQITHTATSALAVKKIKTVSVAPQATNQARLAVANQTIPDQSLPVLTDNTGVVSGAVTTSPATESQPAANNWLWLWAAASFALNLAFCYILVKLMLKKTQSE